jgi:hypothetical protein
MLLNRFITLLLVFLLLIYKILLVSLLELIFFIAKTINYS